MKTVTKSGLPLTLGQKISATIRGEKYKVAIRGWMENQYLIVDNPNFHGEMVRIAPQTGCMVNYTVDGIFINFKTAVLHSFSQAVSLMILEFPKRFDNHNLRKTQRQKANFPFKYSVDVEMPNYTLPGTLRDISMNGGLFCHAHPLEKGNKIILSLKLPTGDMTGLIATVRNVRRNPANESEPFVTGIEFNPGNEEQKSVLRGFVESRVTDRRERKR